MTTLSEAALILAPQGRDAALASGMLRAGGFDSRICETLGAFVSGLIDGAGFGLVAEEAIATADLRQLSAWLAAQAEWSDFPFILLTQRGGGLERNPAAGRYLETLGNVAFLERPFHPTSLISLARSARRARRKQYEARSRLETIRLGEQRLRVALEAGKLGNWTLDALTFELSASDACKAHYGRSSADAFTYDQLLASVHPEDVARMQAAVRQSHETGEDYDIEYRCIWPDQSVHWVAVHGRIELDAKGQMTQMVGVSKDVTERRAGEETLRAFAAALEERVEERTLEHERISAQLHEAQKLETLGQLTGGVAHDFNNLLMPIMAAMDVIQRRLNGNDPQSTKLLSGAMQSAERAKTLVQRLLGFARRTKLQTTSVDLPALLDGMRDLIKSSLGPAIELRLQVDQICKPVQADPNQLELALLNLCVNARDAMPRGGRLTISVRPSTGDLVRPDGLENGHFVVMSISDTGTGMSEDTLRRAIEPFYSTKEVGQGTGLGLSMVHGLAAQLKGAFVLTSELGRGTTATLWLPEAATSASNIFSRETVVDLGEVRPHSILLVDDEPIVRMATAEMLRELGHDVQEAAGGNEALSQLDQGYMPDILVTDYKMPGMNGPQLIGRVRERIPEIPVLLITGYGGASDNYTEAVRLAKPFGQIELADSIASILRSSADSTLVGHSALSYR